MLTLILVFVLTTILYSPASAMFIDTPGYGVEVQSILLLESPIIKVTIPTCLPVSIDEDGNSITSSDAKIINESHGPIEISNVSVVGVNSWDVVDYDLDMSELPNNTLVAGYTLNGSKTDDNGEFIFDSQDWPPITSNEELPITYDIKIPTQINSVVDMTISNVVLTVGWDLHESFDISEINLNHTNVELRVGESIQLTVDPQTESRVHWSSSITRVSEVDDDGLIIAKDLGVSTVKASVYGKESICKVTVIEALGITLSQSIVNMRVGQTLQLNATAESGLAVSWESTDDSSIQVSTDGLITAKETGTYGVIANSGEFTEVCMVTIFPEEPSVTDYYIFTRDYVNDGWKVSICDEFKYALKNNVDYLEWWAEFPMPNPGSTYLNKPVTDMSSMFESYTVMLLDLVMFDVSNVKVMNRMFANCNSSSMKLDNFDISNVIDISEMFIGAKIKVVYVDSYGDYDRYFHEGSASTDIRFFVNK